MNASAPEASSATPAGKDAAWIAYILHAVGFLSVTMLPAIVGLVLNYVKRGDARGGVADSHHGWMIRTFWYGMLWYLVSLGLVLSSAWPFVHALVFEASRHGTVTIDWGTLFSSIGAAALGGIGFVLTWFWLVYRLIRGIYCLAESRAMP